MTLLLLPVIYYDDCYYNIRPLFDTIYLLITHTFDNWYLLVVRILLLCWLTDDGDG